MSSYTSLIGDLLTTAIIVYTGVGLEQSDHGIQLIHRDGSGYESDYYYMDSGNEVFVIRKQIETLYNFSSKLLGNIKDLEPDFSRVIDEHFNELL